MFEERPITPHRRLAQSPSSLGRRMSRPVPTRAATPSGAVAYQRRPSSVTVCSIRSIDVPIYVQDGMFVEQRWTEPDFVIDSQNGAYVVHWRSVRRTTHNGSSETSTSNR